MAGSKTSIARLLRAPWNFEEDYAGKAGNFPILFTHPFTPAPLAAGVADTFTALDAEAALRTPPEGISPLLAKFCPVPIGSVVALYFPIIRTRDSDLFLSDGWAYVWRALFRFRSVADYVRRKRNRVPYSIGVGRFGAPDTRAGVVFDRPTLNVAGPRVVRPTSVESIIYNRAEPSPDANPPFFGTLHTDAVAIPVNAGAVTLTPYYPGAGMGGAGTVNLLDYEQGEYDPATVIPGQTPRAGATHLSKFLTCMGNEIAIECFKYNLTVSGDPYTPRNWDFTFDVDGNVTGGEDLAFSQLLGVGARGVGAIPPVDTGVRMVTSGQ